MTNIIDAAQSDIQNLSIYQSYLRSKYLSIKHSSYFQVYEELLSKYRGQPITFIEIGVLSGGSLFMWRDFFGPQARIIGIELNPAAKKWEAHGFEIFLGSQSDPGFWENVFNKTGPVDVILDDGGHTNSQQIITTNECIRHIKDGGMLIVEDTHASYMKRFGNPSKSSFINFTKKIIDIAQSRFSGIESVDAELEKLIYSIHFYESIVCMNVDRRKCFTPRQTTNNGISDDAEDYRDRDETPQKGKKWLFWPKK